MFRTPRQVREAFAAGTIDTLDNAVKQLIASGLSPAVAIDYMLQGQKPSVGKPQKPQPIHVPSDKGLNPIGTRTAKGKNAGTFRMVRRTSKSFGHQPAKRPLGTHYKPQPAMKLSADTIIAIKEQNEERRLNDALALNAAQMK